MENIQIQTRVAEGLSLKNNQVQAVLDLTEEGCTIPFISRYRKERTGNLDEISVNSIIENFRRISELEKRREYILTYLKDNDKLTPDLEKKIKLAATLNILEDLYLPYKPRKKTLADKARDLGLEPLANLIKDNNLTKEKALKEAMNYISDDVQDEGSALDHALNIIVQDFSDSSEVRGHVRENMKKGEVVVSVKRGKKEEGSKYKDYFEFDEKVSKMPPHRIMAILRGVNEGYLKVSVESVDDEKIMVRDLTELLFKKKGELLLHAAEDSLKRYLNKSLGNEILSGLKEKAEQESVKIFSKNLERILLSSPFGEKSVIGIDPGIRTGCKTAVIDKNGDFIKFITMNLHNNENEIEKIRDWIKEYSVDGIAIGDGTFGRETFGIAKKFFENENIIIALVDEDGASVYSASEPAREEFPDLDVTVKGAISIARRFQDPLAELVKIDPKSLGVGQYQHDVTPALLKDKLNQTVEWVVNKVGVNVNTAGYHLLGFISGLDKGKAKELVKFRSQNKKISAIDEILKVKGIGNKAYQQCSGFLRVHKGCNVLDSTGVHPESYDDVRKIAKFVNSSVENLVNNPDMIDEKIIRKELQVEELGSIVSELKNRGLDPRKDFQAVQFSDGIESIDDLKEGMILNGVVDNVVAFGAFVDIGIKDKGLVHISEVSSDYIEDITSAIFTGDSVRVKIVSIDTDRKRIGLSIKQAI